MCSIQDAFPDFSFSNNSVITEQKISKAKTDLLQMQDERGKMMSFQSNNTTTPYFLQNEPNTPHVINNNLNNDYSISNSDCSCPLGQCSCNTNNTNIRNQYKAGNIVEFVGNTNKIKKMNGGQRGGLAPFILAIILGLCLAFVVTIT